MHAKMLNPDQLGQKGQHYFAGLCADAKLVCNPSSYDRTGWDFIIEFPVLDSKPAALETRKKPLACLVQVKTMWEWNDRFKMRLTSAECLAKELKPAFICVLKFNKNLDISSMHLIHMADDPLSKILRRLRKCDIDNGRASNRATISMSASADGRSIESSGEALGEAILDACGCDLASYVDNKKKQLAEIGYGPLAFSMQMNLETGGYDHLVDWSLGLAGPMQAKKLKAADIRFGLRKVRDDMSGEVGSIRINPSPVDECSIAVLGLEEKSPTTFSGKIFSSPLPNIPEEYRKILIVTDFFRITLQKRKWTLKSIDNVDRQTPASLGAYWRFAKAITSGEGMLRISAKSKLEPIELGIPKSISLNTNTKDFDRIICLCDGLSQIVRRAGLVEEPLLHDWEMYDCEEQITLLTTLINHPNRNVSMELSLATPLMEHSFDGPTKMVYVDWMQLGEVTLGFYGVCTVIKASDQDGEVWKFNDFKLQELLPVKPGEEGVEWLKARASERSGCDGIWARQ